MTHHLPSRLSKSMALAALALTGWFGGAEGQAVDAAVREAYFRAVGEHFGVPLQEVTIISEWELSSDEVPVVFFLAQRAGVSADVLIGVRRGGRPWHQVAQRFGLDAQAFHLNLPGESELGSLSRAYGEFRGRPVGEWSRILLEDSEIIALVNLRVLSERTGAGAARIMRAREEAGSFVGSLTRLRPR